MAEVVPDSPTSVIELPDWVPTTSRSTAPRNQTRLRRGFQTEGESGLGLLAPHTHDSDSDSASGTSHRGQSTAPSSRDGRSVKIDIRPAKIVIIPPDEDRIAKRQMTSWQLFVSPK